MEKNEDGVWTMSLGRIAWWLAFIPALIIWIKAKGGLSDGVSNYDISPNHLTILLTLASYNFGKKLADAVTGIMAAKKAQNKNIIEEDGPG